MSSKLKKIFLSILLYVGCWSMVYAQGPPPPPPPPPGLPIDGQIVSLVIVGLLLGVYALAIIAKRANAVTQ